MYKKLLDIIACPLCKGPVEYQADPEALVCKADRLAYPVRDGVPVMLEEEAITLDSEGRPVSDSTP